MTLRELGEEKLLRQLLSGLAKTSGMVVPPGDDCAVLRFSRGQDYLVLKTDCVVESVHFESGAPAAQIGWKAMMRTLSDFAAVSALPRFALVTLMTPGSTTVSRVRRIYAGLNRAAARFDVAIVGGETSAMRRETAISVSAAGVVEPDRLVTRSGGKPGDDLLVTGELGGAFNGRHLTFTARIIEARWLTKHFNVHAMMDLSDGLGSDLPRLARASRLGFHLDRASLPLARGSDVKQAISNGEDYELLFAISPKETETLIARWRKKFPRVRLTHVGKLVSPSATTSQISRGYVHFQERG